MLGMKNDGVVKQIVLGWPVILEDKRKNPKKQLIIIEKQ